MHTSISLLQPLLCFCSSPLWRHLYYGGIIFIVYPFSTLCDTCSGSTAWDGPPRGKREGMNKRLPRPCQRPCPLCHHVLYLDPRSCGGQQWKRPQQGLPESTTTYLDIFIFRRRSNKDTICSINNAASIFWSGDEGHKTDFHIHTISLFIREVLRQ